jgi:hypothetical protein
VRDGRPVGGASCTPRNRRFAAHLELFARGRVVPVPAGIGVGPQSCAYPVWTADPTGVLSVDAPPGTLTLADVFAVWGQPLGGHRLAGFASRGGVRVYVNGRRTAAAAPSIPIRPHDEIVLAIGPRVPVHRSYLFPPGT